MSLSIVDVSYWQDGLDFSSLKSSNAVLAGAICRASHGDSIDSTFKGFMGQLEDLDLLMGAYHYIEGSGVDIEVARFLSQVKPYLGRCILCLDWERTANAMWGHNDYLESFIKEIIRRTGVLPLVYASAADFPHEICERNNLGKWVAQYATVSVANGFQDVPWNEGAYECAIRQYSGNGRLSGYDGAIDLDKAYMDVDAWGRYANPDGVVNDSGNDVENSDNDYIELEFAGTVKITKDSLT